MQNVEPTTTSAKVSDNTPFTISAIVTGGKSPNGTVTFNTFNNLLLAVAPLSKGEAQIGLGQMSVRGLYQITATYSGDYENLLSTSAPLTQVLTGTATTEIQCTSGPNGRLSHALLVTIGVQ